jgi:hypothetical protein
VELFIFALYLLLFYLVMKKIIFSAIVLFCFFFQSYAQVTFGPKIGVGFSRENYAILRQAIDLGINKQETKYIPLPNISMVVDIPLSKIISFRPEFGYRVQEYSSISHTFSSYTSFTDVHTDLICVEKINAHVDYLELPVNLAFKLPFIDKRLEIVTGATLGRCIGGKANYESYIVNVTNYTGPQIVPSDVAQVSEVLKVRPKNDYQDAYPQREYVHVKPYNFIINFGLGYKIANRFLINGTFNYGLSNLAPSSFNGPIQFYGTTYNSSTTKKANTYSYTFSLAYMIGSKSLSGMFGPKK